jgi:beta-lactamase regulating signal transducer with metallopeptidase domain/5-hydroxyisourate hydrolase-like protein (transthyretin family)/uncharacterized GH25 family protein
MTAWMEPFAFWLADVYLAATILLVAAAAIFALVRQPSLRMAVAWGIVPGLLLIACLCLSATRPHVRLWPAPPVKTNTAAQNLVTSRRLYAGGLQAAPNARIKTAGVKPAARKSDSTQPSETDDDVSPSSSAPSVAEWEPLTVDDPDHMRFERFEAAPVAHVEPSLPAWASRLLASLVGTFLAGSLFVASWLVLGVWRASRLVRESEPAPQACLDELHALVGAPSRPPRLRVNRRLLTPVATGAVRPAILLPEESLRGGEPHALRAVLAHEWTHIKNGDLWLLALDRIVLSLLWAHPLYWWTRRRFRADQEFLADAAAAAQIGAADYAALLVHWARKVTEQRSLTALTAVGIWERPAGLTERVTTLLADSHREIVRTSGRTRVGVAAALALLSLAAATISLRPPQTELARAEDKSDAVGQSTVVPAAPALPIVQSPPVSESPRSEPAQSTPEFNDVQGTCRDKQGKPLAGVQVFLYAIQKLSGREQLLRQGTTDADGRFRFPDCLGKKAVQLSWQLHDEDGAVFEVFARRADLGTVAKSVQERGQQLDFTLTKAASLTGVVRDPRGQRLAGAIIHDMYFPLRKTGWLSAKSDANGNFTIADLSEYQYGGPKGSGPPLGLLSVEHPEYGMAQVSYKQVPGRVDDVVLDKPAAIVGTVVDGDTGKPAAGIYVFANWIDQPIPAVAVDLPHARTDKNGHYQLRPLPQGLFNLEVSVEPINGIMSFEKRDTKFVAAPIEQFRTQEGQTATAPPIRLVKGGVVKGSLYQYRQGAPGVHDPVKLKEGEKLEIIVFYGPSLPGPGVVGDMTFVRPGGTFELRLPPGMHYLSLPNSQKADGTYRLPYSDMGEPCTEEDAAPPQLNNLHRIKIREGQTTEIELSVFRPLPPQKTVSDEKSQIQRPNAPHSAEALRNVAEGVANDEITGICVDQHKIPVRGAEVLLFCCNDSERTRQLVQQTSTDEYGRFKIIPSPAGRDGKNKLLVVVRHEDLATRSTRVTGDGKSLEFVMDPAEDGTFSKNEMGGICLSGEDSVPPHDRVRLKEVEVSLYIDQFGDWDERRNSQLIEKTKTNDEGKFLFFEIPQINPRVARYLVIARQHGRTTDVATLNPPNAWFDLRMWAARPVKGTVKNESGKPVAGALVRCNDSALYTLPEGIESARTDVRGEFEIDDTSGGGRCLVEHPDYARKAWGLVSFDELAELKLSPGGAIEGQVVDTVTRQPAAGLGVRMQPTRNRENWRSLTVLLSASTKTDDRGRYRIASIPTGTFNVFVSSVPGRASVALDSLAVSAAHVVQAPPIRLVKGGVLKGRLIDDATGQAALVGEDKGVLIEAHGPARPLSGSASERIPVKTDGTFEVRLPPGKNYVYFRGSRSFIVRRHQENGIDVKEGGEHTIEFRVIRSVPMEKAPEKPIKNSPAPASATASRPAPVMLAEAPTVTPKIVDYHVGKDEIGGMCLGRGEARLAGVEVTLYIGAFGEPAKNQRLVHKTSTNNQGQFVFRHVPALDSRVEQYLVIARRQGLDTSVGTLDHRHDWLDLKMAAVRPFKGTVKNEQGKPVVGALVRCNYGAAYGLPEGVLSARTNARGEFEIDDVGGTGRCIIEHPDYARRTLDRVPFNKEAEFKLLRGGVVEGQVIDTVTGQPVGGLSVHTQSIDGAARIENGVLRIDQSAYFGGSATTDSRGLYRIGSIPKGVFNVFVSRMPGRASVALDSLAVSGGQIVQAPPIRLVKGGVVKGRLIDDLTGQPALVGEDESVPIGVHGPSRPRSSAAIETFAVKTDGTFELRLPPGKNFVYVSGGPFLVRKAGDPSAIQDIREVDVKEGTETTIEFRGIRQVPMKQAPEKPAKKSPASTSGAMQRPVQAPPIRLVKPGVVKGRLIDALTGQPALVGDVERVTIGVHGPSTPQSGAAIEGFQVKTDGTFELRLPPGKNFVYVSGGPFLVRKPGDPYANPDVTQVDVKEGTETTIEVRVIRQVPMKETPEKTINKPPAPTSGAVKRPSPIVLAEAPTVSPKIVDYHLKKEAVAGLCLGRDEVRIAGVEVSLYIIGRNDDSHRYIGRTMTNEEGQFVFQHVPQLRPREPRYLGNDEEYLMIARKKGLATALGTLRQRHDWLDLRMRPGVSMNGVVRDEQGHPVTGALVRGWSPPTYGVPEEAPSVRTNARGEFQIDDLEHFGAASVSYPDYINAGFGQSKKNPVVATLRKGSIVEGQVLDGETGQPVAEALVTMEPLGRYRGMFAPRDHRAGVGALESRTDGNGRYKFRSLRPGTFWLSFRGGPGGVATAILDGLKVGRQQTVDVPPVRIAKGATVTLRLVLNDWGRQVNVVSNETVVIGIRSGEASASADTKPRLERLHMRHDGTIGVWLPAGKHAISLNGGPFFSLGDVQQGIGHDLRQVDIKGGEDATVLFRVVRITPSQSGGISRVQRGAF